MMKAKTLPVFAILMLLSLRSAEEIKFQLTQATKSKDNAWEKFLANPPNKNPINLNIDLQDIIATEEDNVVGKKVKKLINILDNTTLTKVTFCDLPGEGNEKRNYLRVIKDGNKYDIKNNANESDELDNDLDNYCKEKNLTKIPDIKNGITFDGTFNVEEGDLPDLKNIDDDKDSLELYIESATNIAAVFKIRENRRLLIL